MESRFRSKYLNLKRAITLSEDIIFKFIIIFLLNNKFKLNGGEMRQMFNDVPEGGISETF